MSDILSREEIDELLLALSKAEEPAAPEAPKRRGRKKRAEAQVTPAPDERVATLCEIFDSYSQLLAKRLAAQFRADCECETLSIQEQTAYEFLSALPPRFILAELSAPSFDMTQLMVISPETAYMLISRLFGGKHLGDPEKPFSELDTAVIELFLRRNADLYNEAWLDIRDIGVNLKRVIAVSGAVSAEGLNIAQGPACSITLRLRIGEEYGGVFFLVPLNVIEK